MVDSNPKSLLVRRWILLVLAASIATDAMSAMSIYLTHAYGEFVDRGNVSLHVNLPAGVAWDCLQPVVKTQAGHQIILTGRTAPPIPPISCYLPFAVLPPLPVGIYEITARLVAADNSIVEAAAQSVQILPLEGRCNADPTVLPPLFALHKTLSAAQFANRLATEPDYAASLGNPTVISSLVGIGTRDYAGLAYPPLVDPTVEFDRLATSGQFENIWRNGYACLSAAPPDQISQFVEFFNAGLDHYFYTGDATEIAAIEAGKVGPGWSRTGKSFRAVTAPGCIESSGKTLVYRFFGIPGAGPNSHFFARDRAECYVVDKSAQWSFEGVPFWASAPLADGTCAVRSFETQVPLYRVWRPFGDSNHRFTTERAVVTEMANKGWVDEGPAMCALPSS